LDVETRAAVDQKGRLEMGQAYMKNVALQAISSLVIVKRRSFVQGGLSAELFQGELGYRFLGDLTDRYGRNNNKIAIKHEDTLP